MCRYRLKLDAARAAGTQVRRSVSISLLNARLTQGTKEYVLPT